MIEEQLSDAERRRILGLLMDAIPRTGRDRQLTGLIKKLSGPDTVVKVRRAYPSTPQRSGTSSPAEAAADE